MVRYQGLSGRNRCDTGLPRISAGMHRHGPYAADIHRAIGLPVFSIYGFVAWFQSALQLPAAF